jgi:hypothetical protein
MTLLSSLSQGEARGRPFHLVELVELTSSLEPGLCLALSLGVIGLFALASVCGAVVFFMLVFLRAFLREARPPDSIPGKTGENQRHSSFD